MVPFTVLLVLAFGFSGGVRAGEKDRLRLRFNEGRALDLRPARDRVSEKNAVVSPARPEPKFRGKRLPNRGQVTAVATGLNSFELQKALADAIHCNGVPAVAATVVKDGVPFATAATGVRKLGQPDTVRIDEDMWQLGSITKIFTKDLARRTLKAQGMTWDTKLKDALPADVSQGMHSKLKDRTVRELAAHCAGLANSYEGSPMMFPNLGSVAGTRHEHIRLGLAKAPPHPFDPSLKKDHYSNFGYVVLSMVATHNGPDAVYEHAIINTYFAPNGITKWYFGEAGALGDQVWPHVTFKKPTIVSLDGSPVPVAKIKDTLPFNTYAPAGHISVTIVDSNKLLRAYMKGGGESVGRFDGSNGRNYARTHIYPKSKWAYMICTNCGGQPGVDAVTQVEKWINANFK